MKLDLSVIKDNFIKIKDFIITAVPNVLIKKKGYSQQEIDAIASLNHTKYEHLTAFLYDIFSILISTVLIFFILWLIQIPVNYFFPDFINAPIIIGKSIKQLLIPVYSVYAVIAIFIILLNYLNTIKIINFNLKEKQN